MLKLNFKKHFNTQKMNYYNWQAKMLLSDQARRVNKVERDVCRDTNEISTAFWSSENKEFDQLETNYYSNRSVQNEPLLCVMIAVLPQHYFTYQDGTDGIVPSFVVTDELTE